MHDQIAAELMKTRTRWLPYVLFAVMLLGAGLQSWIFGYVQWWDIHDDRSADPQNVAAAIRTLAFPWSLSALLDAGQFWGSILVGVLVSSAVATEYNWGTVRHAIARGQTRGEWLFAKLAGTAIISTAMMLAALAAGVFFLLMANTLADLPISLSSPEGDINVFDVFVMIVRSAFCVLPYALLAFLLTVVGRSTALGATGVILFVIIENVLLGIFGALGGFWGDLRIFFIGHNVQSLLAANRIGDGEYLSVAFRGLPDASDTPDPWLAFAILAVYCAAFVGVAWYVFDRRDLRLGTGE